MTDDGESESTDEGEGTLADVDHTHPLTDETFGGVYRRGPAVADGAGPAVGRDDPERLRDVDHDPAGAETTAANALWERGDGVRPDSPPDR